MERKEVKQFNRLLKSMTIGDESALDEFLAVYGKLIYATAVLITKSHFLADEILYEVLDKIWRTAQKLTKIKTPKGWLYKITVNSAKDKLRREVQLYEVPSEQPFEQKIDELLDADEFLYYISFVNESEQQILIFKFIEDMSFKMIAKEMRMPLGTVTAAYYRALDKIKKIISDNCIK